MIKIVALIPRRPDLARDAFLDYYEHQHVPLFRRVIPDEVARAITHYVQNHAASLGTGTNEPPYDCVTEIGFDDLAGMQVWSRWDLGEDGKVLRDDEEHFMDLPRRVVIVTEVHDLTV